MAAADTNVLLRLLLDDDVEQSRAARAFQRTHAPLFVSHVVLAELAWVLVSVYRFSRERLRAVVEMLVDTTASLYRSRTWSVTRSQAFKRRAPTSPIASSSRSPGRGRGAPGHVRQGARAPSGHAKDRLPVDGASPCPSPKPERSSPALFVSVGCRDIRRSVRGVGIARHVLAASSCRPIPCNQRWCRILGAALPDATGKRPPSRRRPGSKHRQCTSCPTIMPPRCQTKVGAGAGEGGGKR